MKKRLFLTASVLLLLIFCLFGCEQKKEDSPSLSEPGTSEEIVNEEVTAGLEDTVAETEEVTLEPEDTAAEPEEVPAEPEDTAAETEEVENEEVTANTEEDADETNETEEIASSGADIAPLEVHFMDVGQGDATLLSCGSHYVLIDTGNSFAASSLQIYLHEHNVHVLDALILTHPDADHIGGADIVTTKYQIETVYVNGNKADTQTYEEFSDSMKERWISGKVPAAGSTFEFGDATITFLSDTSLFEGNDASIVLMVEHGNNRFIFTGDAESASESALLDSNRDIHADVYQAGHHGSSSSSSPEFLKAINPKSVVISCGIDNTYGHPHEETLAKLDELGCDVYRTDLQGSIIAYSDGETIQWTEKPTELIPDEELGVDEFEYIGNINNKKLHLSSCTGTLPAVQNRVYFDTLAEAEAAGFNEENQCKNCKPYLNGTN